jgi:hypothetical protein
MARFYDDREDEMIPLVRELEAMPELASPYARRMADHGEYQEALEVFLKFAAKRQVPIPAHIINAVMKIAADLLPSAGVIVADELVAG